MPSSQNFKDLLGNACAVPKCPAKCLSYGKSSRIANLFYFNSYKHQPPLTSGRHWVINLPPQCGFFFTFWFLLIILLILGMVRQFFTACMPLSHLPINWENVLRNKKGRMGLKHEFTLCSHIRILTSFPENFSFIEVLQISKLTVLFLCDI